MKKRNYHYSSNLLSLVCIVALLCMTSVTFSQEGYETESPYFSVNCPDTVNADFPLISTDVNATISGVIANVEMEQMYANSGDTTVEATYVFPMSTNAAIYKMQMTVGDRVIDAVIKRKDEAREIYETAKDSGQTASLLEQHRPNVFQMSIANIQPDDTVLVKMTYTELIEPEGGVYEFVVPSIVGPRYTTGGEEWISKSISDSLSVGETALNFNVKINAGMEVTANCVSHDASFTNEGKTSHGHLATNPGKDIIVEYTLAGNQIETGLLLYEGEEENFFLAMIQPPKPDVPYESPKREYVFIMDVSGSMTGTPIQISKELITDLLYDLNDDDKFNIVFFAGGSSVLAANSLPVNSENINLATDMIDELDAGGGTELLSAMERALTMEGTASYSRTFVILTDGFVSVEKESYDLIREHLNDANFFSFGIGTSVNREIIEGIAYVGQGESFVVTDLNNAQTTADTYKKYIENPVLTNIETSFSGIDVYDIEPISIPDVFAERPILIYGKYDNAENGTIEVEGDYADGPITSTLNFADYSANADENIALKYLWARKRIKLMSDYGIASNEEDNLSIEEEVTNMGLKYNLVTAYTSFVAVDSMSVTNVEENNNNTDPYSDEALTNANHRMVDRDPGKNNVIQIIGSNAIKGHSLDLYISPETVMNHEKMRFMIVDVRGTVLIDKELISNELNNMVSFDITGFSQGVYCVTLFSGNQRIDTKKFVIME